MAALMFYRDQQRVGPVCQNEARRGVRAPIACRGLRSEERHYRIARWPARNLARPPTTFPRIPAGSMSGPGSNDESTFRPQYLSGRTPKWYLR